MKKIMKTVCKILPVVLVGLIIITNVFGISVPTQDSLNAVGGGGEIDNVNILVGNIWGTVKTILQVLAVAAVVFAGVRYMFASANDKADIKKQTIILVVGAILVFGATTILTWIQGTVEDVVK